MRKYQLGFRRKISKFIELPFRDQLLLAETFVLLVLIRFCLTLLPFDKLYSIIKIFLNKATCKYTDHINYTNKIVWSVELTGQYVLKEKCIAQALAVHIFLNRKRIGNTLQIGFLRCRNDNCAHAWVKTEDAILIGGSRKLHLYFQVLY